MSNSTMKYMSGYPDYIGKNFAFVCKGTGPKSYNATTGDVIALPGFQHNIDCADQYVETVSGTYYLLLHPSVAGGRATWTAHWYTVGGVTEVTTAVDLSAETYLIKGLGGPS